MQEKRMEKHRKENENPSGNFCPGVTHYAPCSFLFGKIQISFLNVKKCCMYAFLQSSDSVSLAA